MVAGALWCGVYVNFDNIFDTLSRNVPTRQYRSVHKTLFPSNIYRIGQKNHDHD